jgi:splicing factor 3B subunit 2
MDDFNRPLYGDVFGVVQGAEIAHQNEINKDLWGEIEQVDVESEEEESDEEEEEEGPGEGDEDGEEMEGPGGRRRIPPGGTETPSGLATPSGMQSITSTVPGGLETPEFIDLRKQRDGTESEVPARDSGPRDLYTVIPERETSSRGFMGSTTAYDVAGASGVGAASGAAVLGADDGRKRRDGVEISITETDDLSQADLKRKYEESRASANRVHVPGADVDRSGFDDVVAGEMKKRQRKDEKKGKEKEKYKF